MVLKNPIIFPLKFASSPIKKFRPKNHPRFRQEPPPVIRPAQKKPPTNKNSKQLRRRFSPLEQNHATCVLAKSGILFIP